MSRRFYTFFFLLFSFTICNAQDAFVRKYTSYVTKVDNRLSEWEDTDLTVVFNEKETDNVVMYYPSKTITLFKIGSVKTDKTINGEEYQIIECVDGEGNKLSLQLFSNSTLRILTDEGFIEFHK